MKTHGNLGGFELETFRKQAWHSTTRPRRKMYKKMESILSVKHFQAFLSAQLIDGF